MDDRVYTLNDFDFHLPDELIAQHPARERDSSRLLVLDRKTGEMIHAIFRDMDSFLKKGDLLVFNDARVIRGRLFFTRESGGSVEVVLTEKIDSFRWRAITNRTKRLRVGEMIFSRKDPGISFTVTKKLNEGIEIQSSMEVNSGLLDRIGEIPLPPYITRAAGENDAERYQTVYASSEGSVAAPTAGLHFTEELIKKLSAKGAESTRLTLDVSFGTFRPVRDHVISRHIMHSERYSMTEPTAEKINSTRENGGRIIAVGTTSLRVMESCFRSGKVVPSRGETDIFIYPPREIRSTDCLITNFHTPRSTLLMLVAAFAGLDLIMKAYEEAIAKEYRFYSYGDSMLIL